MEDKVRSYLDGGAEAVWVLNPERKRLTAYDRTGHLESIELPHGEIANEALFPGLRIPLTEFFAGVE
jgi:Uma2 family endonuclease